MITIHRLIKERSHGTRMILQVHDELIFEVPDGEIEAMKKLVKQEMEGVLKLAVPIKVEMGVGKNWDQAH